VRGADGLKGGGGGAGAFGSGGGAERSVEDGFREPGGGGGGFLPIGGGGPFRDTEENGLGASEFAAFLTAIEGCKEGALAVPGRDGLPGMAGAAPKGGLGADRGAVSESERYEASRFAAEGQRRNNNEEISSCFLPPVSTPPPVFRSFGIPPANRPASGGGALFMLDVSGWALLP
jgi:hypothetical protein